MTSHPAPSTDWQVGDVVDVTANLMDLCGLKRGDAVIVTAIENKRPLVAAPLRSSHPQGWWFCDGSAFTLRKFKIGDRVRVRADHPVAHKDWRDCLMTIVGVSRLGGWKCEPDDRHLKPSGALVSWTDSELELAAESRPASAQSAPFKPSEGDWVLVRCKCRNGVDCIIDGRVLLVTKVDGDVGYEFHNGSVVYRGSGELSFQPATAPSSQSAKAEQRGRLCAHGRDTSDICVDCERGAKAKVDAPDPTTYTDDAGNTYDLASYGVKEPREPVGVAQDRRRRVEQHAAFLGQASPYNEDRSTGKGSEPYRTNVALTASRGPHVPLDKRIAAVEKHLADFERPVVRRDRRTGKIVEWIPSGKDPWECDE